MGQPRRSWMSIFALLVALIGMGGAGTLYLQKSGAWTLAINGIFPRHEKPESVDTDEEQSAEEPAEPVLLKSSRSTPQTLSAADEGSENPFAKLDAEEQRALALPPPTKSAAVRPVAEEPQSTPPGVVDFSEFDAPKQADLPTKAPLRVRTVANEESTEQKIADDSEAPQRTAKRPSQPQSQEVDLDAARQLIRDGQVIQAHRMLSEWYWKHPADRELILKDLEPLAKTIYFSPQPLGGIQYEVQSGDQLAKIAKNHKLSWQYVGKLNQVNPRKLRAGKSLKVFQGPFSACVDLSDFELTVHHKGLFIRRYQVGVGKDNSSPIGEFAVREKLENPTYYGPNGDVREADDPLNPLGERWIDIGNSFGIHGTIEPDSVGKSASRGCLRMRAADVEEVYDLLTVGSLVRIQR